MHIQKTVLKITNKTPAVIVQSAKRWILDRLGSRLSRQKRHHEKSVLGAMSNKFQYKLHIWGYESGGDIMPVEN